MLTKCLGFNCFCKLGANDAARLGTTFPSNHRADGTDVCNTPCMLHLLLGLLHNDWFVKLSFVVVDESVCQQRLLSFGLAGFTCVVNVCTVWRTRNNMLVVVAHQLMNKADLCCHTVCEWILVLWFYDGMLKSSAQLFLFQKLCAASLGWGYVSR